MIIYHVVSYCSAKLHADSFRNIIICHVTVAKTDTNKAALKTPSERVVLILLPNYFGHSEIQAQKAASF